MSDAALMVRTDRLAATTGDEWTQMNIAREGDTAQRDLLLTNPNLTARTVEWLIVNWEFNPRIRAQVESLPHMSDDLRSRVRYWGAR